MKVAEGQTLLRGHLVIALVKLLVGLLAEGAEVSALEVGGGGSGNKAGLEDIYDGGVKTARLADILPRVKPLHHPPPRPAFQPGRIAPPPPLVCPRHPCPF